MKRSLLRKKELRHLCPLFSQRTLSAIWKWCKRSTWKMHYCKLAGKFESCLNGGGSLPFDNNLFVKKPKCTHTHHCLDRKILRISLLWVIKLAQNLPLVNKWGDNFILHPMRGAMCQVVFASFPSKIYFFEEHVASTLFFFKSTKSFKTVHHGGNYEKWKKEICGNFFLIWEFSLTVRSVKRS